MRLTHFYKSDRKGMFAGLGLGVARSKELDFIFPKDDPLTYSTYITYSFELGYSITNGIKCNLDFGNIPGIINLSFSIQIL